MPVFCATSPVAGNKYFAVAIFSSDVAAGLDIDLYVYQGNKQLGASISLSSSEFLEWPAGLREGNYTIYADVYKGDTTNITVYVHTWFFPSGGPSTAPGPGTMQVSPTSVLARPDDDSCCPITLQFSNLDLTSTMPKR